MKPNKTQTEILRFASRSFVFIVLCMALLLCALTHGVKAAELDEEPTITVSHAMACVAYLLGPQPRKVASGASKWPADFPSPDQVRVEEVDPVPLWQRGVFAELVHTPTNPGSPWTIRTPEDDASVGIIIEVAKFWTNDWRTREEVATDFQSGRCG